MANNTKAEPKPVKKNNINYKKLVRKFVAKPLAYVTVMVLASYGMRQALHTLDDRAATIITVLAILALCWIIVDER